MENNIGAVDTLLVMGPNWATPTKIGLSSTVLRLNRVSAFLSNLLKGDHFHEAESANQLWNLLNIHFKDTTSQVMTQEGMKNSKVKDERKIAWEIKG